MRPHPLGVLPEGNRYLVSPEAAAASARARLEGLGAFAALPDATLMRLLGGGDEDDGVGAEALASLSLVSRVFRAFACHEDLWKAEVLRRDGGAFVFRGASWRETYRRAVSASADDAPAAGDDGNERRTNAGGKASPRLERARAAPPPPHIFSDALYSRHLAMHRPLDPAWLEKETIPVMRVPATGARRGEETARLRRAFVDGYESKNAPVIVRGACAHWAATRDGAWTLDALARRANDKDLAFDVGGYAVRLANWRAYCDASRPPSEGGEGPADDAPLYLFDKKFAETAPEVFSESASTGYRPPEVICGPNDDLFALLGPNRPDHRWFIHGPARSGSLFHVDPNGTSAWNAVVSGAKRWILFKPDGAPPPGVHPSRDGAVVAQPVTLVEWYASFYEHAYERDDSDDDSEASGAEASERARAGRLARMNKKGDGPPSRDASRYEVLEGTCREGDVLFIPSGWWHAALNLTETTAVTHNFCSPRTAPRVLRFLKRAAASGKGGDASPGLAADLVSGLESRDARGSLYADFLEALRKHRPEVLRAEAVRRVLGGDGPGEAGTGGADGGNGRRQKKPRREAPRRDPDPDPDPDPDRRARTSPPRPNALAGLFAAETRAESAGFAFGFR